MKPDTYILMKIPDTMVKVYSQCNITNLCEKKCKKSTEIGRNVRKKFHIYISHFNDPVCEISLTLVFWIATILSILAKFVIFCILWDFCSRSKHFFEVLEEYTFTTSKSFGFTENILHKKIRISPFYIRTGQPQCPSPFYSLFYSFII